MKGPGAGEARREGRSGDGVVGPGGGGGAEPARPCPGTGRGRRGTGKAGGDAGEGSAGATCPLAFTSAFAACEVER